MNDEFNVAFNKMGFTAALLAKAVCISFIINMSPLYVSKERPFVRNSHTNLVFLWIKPSK
jgi:hypothetical protein